MQILAYLLDLIALYYSVLFVSSLTIKKQTVDYSKVEPKTRFAVLIPAHNEELVIGDLIQDLAEQEYPHELFDIYVIDDGSTDKTSQIVSNLTTDFNNLILMLRKEGGRGKPRVLNYALQNLRAEAEYDSVAIFDADNRVERLWLRKADYEYQQGNKLLQTNVKTKNPDQSLLTRLIYYEYLVFARIWQLGKSRLLWCNAFAGTGMAIDLKLLKSFGLFDETALTEDLELTIRLFQEGHRVTYLHEACIWDEKPATLRPFFKQRVRWATGHLLACRKLFGRGSLIGRWEANFYLFAIVLPLCVLAAWIFSIVDLLGLVTFQPQTTFIWIFTSSAFLLTMLLAGLQEGDKRILRYLIPLHIYLLHWIVVVLVSLVKAFTSGSHTQWAKTPHNFTVHAARLPPAAS